MPAVRCIDRHSNGDKNAEIYFQLPMRQGGDPKTVQVSPRHGPSLIPCKREVAHVRAYMYNGGWRVFRPGDEMLIEDHEYTFVSTKWPGLLEVTNASVRSADEGTKVLMRENEMHRTRIASLESEVEGLKRSSDVAVVRAADGEHSAVVLLEKNRMLEQEVASLKAELLRKGEAKGGAKSKKPPAPETGTTPALGEGVKGASNTGNLTKLEALDGDDDAPDLGLGPDPSTSPTPPPDADKK